MASAPDATDERLLLAGIVGEAVACRETRSEDADDSLLWPEEAEQLAAVSSKRYRDFTLGRRCARLAMADLGLAPAPVLRGEHREPRWPTGVVGAITHTTGFAAAALARSEHLRSIGIDAEENGPLPGGISERIARPEELDRLGAWQSEAGGVCVDRLLFCIKESVYKVWYPLAGSWLGYLDATASVDPRQRTFDVQILVDGPISRLSGRYAFDELIVVAVIELPA